MNFLKSIYFWFRGGRCLPAPDEFQKFVEKDSPRIVGNIANVLKHKSPWMDCLEQKRELMDE